MCPRHVDANQREIVADLRAIGASVLHLHTVGRRCPDLLIGFRGINYLVEIKTARGQPTRKQQRWHKLWRGQVAVIRSVEDALEIMGVEISTS